MNHKHLSDEELLQEVKRRGLSEPKEVLRS